MTTIAIKNGVMVSDGRVTGGYGGIDNNRPKIHKFGDSIFGFTGSYRNKEIWEEWVEKGCILSEAPKEAVIIRLSPGNKITIFDSYDGFIEEIDSKICAIGFGYKYAIGALEAGATAQEAIKIASKYDEYTNSNITEVKL